MSLLEAGCGGTAAQWHVARSVDDPRDGSIRTAGAAADGCLLLPGGPLAGGVVSALLTSQDGPAGFVLRYRSAADHVRLEVDLGAGWADARQMENGGHQSLGTLHFDPFPEGPHRVVASFVGRRIVLFVDGEEVYRVTSGDAQALRTGRVGLLAVKGATAEFDEVDLRPLPHGGGPILEPLPAGVPVGQRVDLALRCLGDPCVVELARGGLPPGLTLTAQGHLAGRPVRPGDYVFGVRPRAGAAATGESIPARLRVRAVSWPRFPFDLDTHQRRTLAVLYTPDDIGQSITWAKLGRPDGVLFRLHHDHPDLRITVTACAANRYLSEQPLEPTSPAAAVWKSLALDPAYDWLELGGHGYTHSPEKDRNLDHHEFAVAAEGCNIDHTRMGTAAYCRRHMTLARDAFRALGIPDDLVVVMRFPGMQDSPEALRAAAASGFTAILGSRHADEAGREWWVPYPGGEMLEIENSSLSHCFTRSAGLEKALADGSLAPEALPRDARFLSEVQRGRDYVDRIALRGGILNLFDHWWDTFKELGGAAPRYLVLDAVLSDIETRYGRAIWYPTARDLALWLEARRFARVDWRPEEDGLHIGVRPPDAWRRMSIAGLDQASLVVGLPAGYTGVSRILIRESGGDWRLLDAKEWWLGGGGVVVSFPLRGPVDLRILPEELP